MCGRDLSPPSSSCLHYLAHSRLPCLLHWPVCKWGFAAAIYLINYRTTCKTTSSAFSTPKKMAVTSPTFPTCVSALLLVRPRKRRCVRYKLLKPPGWKRPEAAVNQFPRLCTARRFIACLPLPLFCWLTLLNTEMLCC